jgi:Xaa-Pro aminopeptidase
MSAASTARLIHASSEQDADLLWRTEFLVGDPILWWEVDGQTHAVLNALEIDRAKRTARIDRIWTMEELLGPKPKSRSAAAQVLAVVKKFKLKTLEVPENFPVVLVLVLQKNRVKIRVGSSPFFPERMVKTDLEVEKLTGAVRVAEAGLERGLEVLRRAKILRDGSLLWNNAVLTSEILRGEIDATVVKAGGLPAHTIVAGGDQACDPHERGSGPLRAHEAIILDIFPRHAATGYFGDLTRTVVKGRPTEELRRLYATVQQGKAWVMEKMRAGVDGAKLHNELTERFRHFGYPTELRDGRWVGFFHGTGHGLGLEIHEAPRFSAGKLFKGLVITVEPGLYYPGIGGVRLEDVVLVQSKGVKNLTQVPQILEVP